jgi:hypothetical protein
MSPEAKEDETNDEDPSELPPSAPARVRRAKESAKVQPARLPRERQLQMLADPPRRRSLDEEVERDLG